MDYCKRVILSMQAALDSYLASLPADATYQIQVMDGL